MILNEKQENTGVTQGMTVWVKERKEEKKIKEIAYYICTGIFFIGCFHLEYFSIFILNSCHTTMMYFIVVTVAWRLRICTKIQLLVQCSPYP